MKLYHGEKIIPGLIIFVVMFTFPVWFNLAPGGTVYDAELRDADRENGCLFDTDEMRTSHMQKLTEWRDLVVREGQRYAEDKKGDQVKMSLTSACMSCHVNTSMDDARQDKAVHCSVCHEHVDVVIYCWDCHLDPANPLEELQQKEQK